MNTWFKRAIHRLGTWLVEAWDAYCLRAEASERDYNAAVTQLEERAAAKGDNLGLVMLAQLRYMRHGRMGPFS